MSKKTLEELVFHDDFMFAAVMMDAEKLQMFSGTCIGDPD